MRKGNRGRWREGSLKSGAVLLLDLTGAFFSVFFVEVTELHTYDLHTFFYVCYVCFNKKFTKKKNQVINYSREPIK